MRLFFVLIITISLSNLDAQQLTLETNLDPIVHETSGLLYLNNKLITHNDSGNTPQLFEINVSNGSVERTITITNATNIDWEDITRDDTYIYIADFGNNSGDRTDLKVYRVSIDDYLNNINVTADIINFSYANQVDYSSSPFATNYDAEALIHYNNKLYIFTKNWVNQKSNIYEIPKQPGSYTLSILDTIESDGLITGATFNFLDNSIMLCGYNASSTFIIQLINFESGLFSNGNMSKLDVDTPATYSNQIEGIAPINDTEYFFSSEENSSGSSGLFRFNAATLSIIDNRTSSLTLYPNPTSTYITIGQHNSHSYIYSVTGQLLKTSNRKKIDISNLSSGTYILKTYNSDGHHLSTIQFVKN